MFMFILARNLSSIFGYNVLLITCVTQLTTVALAVTIILGKPYLSQ